MLRQGKKCQKEKKMIFLCLNTMKNVKKNVYKDRGEYRKIFLSISMEKCNPLKFDFFFSLNFFHGHLNKK